MACGFCTFSSVTSTTCVTLARSVKEAARLGQIARADLDIVTPLGQVDADRLGRVIHAIFLSRSRSVQLPMALLTRRAICNRL